MEKEQEEEKSEGGDTGKKRGQRCDLETQTVNNPVSSRKHWKSYFPLGLENSTLTVSFWKLPFGVVTGEGGSSCCLCPEVCSENLPVLSPIYRLATTLRVPWWEG